MISSIAAQILRHKVTHLQCTPSMARMIAMNDEARAALAGVQAPDAGRRGAARRAGGRSGRATGAPVQNMYGPTETTIWSTTGDRRAGAEAVANIGTPIANTQVYVLDDAQAPLPVGAPGELWIGGDGVTRGYWQRPDLTAERFLPDPFAPGRMYRTGDLVRWRADGRLDFLGRADHQVKLRGYRIELGEIEAALEASPASRQAVVMAREDVPGDVRLVAYVTGTAGPDGGAARGAGRAPARPIWCPRISCAGRAFPLTPNRKVDRKALPARSAARRRRPSRRPSAPTGGEGADRGSGAGAGVPKVGRADNFFALGGHSLLAVQAHREIREALGTTGCRSPTSSAFLPQSSDRAPVWPEGAIGSIAHCSGCCLAVAAPCARVRSPRGGCGTRNPACSRSLRAHLHAARTCGVAGNARRRVARSAPSWCSAPRRVCSRRSIRWCATISGSTPWRCPSMPPRGTARRRSFNRWASSGPVTGSPGLMRSRRD
jgi:hypothetical protein